MQLRGCNPVVESSADFNCRRTLLTFAAFRKVVKKVTKVRFWSKGNLKKANLILAAACNALRKQA